MATLGKRIKLAIIPGVNPLEDSTPLDTILFTDGDKIRFQEGKLRKVGGWQRIFSQNNQTILGVARNIFSCRDQKGNPITIIGTTTRLYAYSPLQNDSFYNITPLNVTPIAIPNAFSTEYNSAVDVPVNFTIHSPIITLEITNYFQNGDLINISGVTGTYFGIPAANINGTFPVTVVSNAAVQINVGIASNGTGQDTINMTWAASYLYVNYPANGLLKGDRIKIAASGNVDGILAASINGETIITNIVDENTFTIQTDTIATSAVTGAGGAGTTIQTQIPAGVEEESIGYGYGGGNYGVGDYGDAKIFNNPDNVIYPRIWSMDKYGNNLILTPGDGASTDPNLYIWTNFDIDVAPTLITAISGSPVPTGVKWVYVSNNSVCTLGSQGLLNQLYFSDQSNVLLGNNGYDQWTPGPSTFSYVTVLDQAGPLISQASARNHDIVFTSSEVYNLQFINKPQIWLIRKLFATDGIIAPKARSEIEDAVFWMGQGDFYVFDGYTVNILPNNTVKRYVYDNINWAASSTCFTFPNVEFNEIWFFYPAGQDINPNNYVIYNYKESHWSIGTLSRTAAEEPTNVSQYPLLIQSNITNALVIPNSLSTFFYTLGANPLTTTNTSDNVVVDVAITAYLFPGDKIFISGATNTNGILAADLNGERTVTSVTRTVGYGTGLYGVGDYGDPPIQSISFTAGSAATSSGTGGGSAITIGTAIIGINSGLNTINAGDTVSITNAVGFGGFSSAEINSTNKVLFALGGYLQINVDTMHAFSTSSVINSGGPNVTINYGSSDRLFQHEVGVNDYNSAYNPATDPSENQYAPMLSYATTCYAQIDEGDNTMVIYSFYPDLKQKGGMTLNTNVKLYAQSPLVHNVNSNFQATYTLNPTTTKVDVMMVGRQRQYQFVSNVIDGNFLLGNCYEEIKPSSTR
jgi:hypothetical protein